MISSAKRCRNLRVTILLLIYINAHLYTAIMSLIGMFLTTDYGIVVLSAGDRNLALSVREYGVPRDPSSNIYPYLGTLLHT